MPEETTSDSKYFAFNFYFSLLIAGLLTWLLNKIDLIPNDGFWYLIPFVGTMILYFIFIVKSVDGFLESFFNNKFVVNILKTSLSIVKWLLILSILTIILFFVGGWITALPPMTVIIFLLIYIAMK